MNLLPRVQGQLFPEKRARQAKVAEREGKGVMVLGEQRSREVSPRAEATVFVRSHGARSCVFVTMLRPAWRRVNAWRGLLVVLAAVGAAALGGIRRRGEHVVAALADPVDEGQAPARGVRFLLGRLGLGLFHVRPPPFPVSIFYISSLIASAAARAHPGTAPPSPPAARRPPAPALPVFPRCWPASPPAGSPAARSRSRPSCASSRRARGRCRARASGSGCSPWPPSRPPPLPSPPAPARSGGSSATAPPAAPRD